MKRLVILCCAILVGLSAASAHHSVSYFETREINLPFSGSFDAETNGVGSISVRAWENDYVLVRAHVNTSAWDEVQARAIANLVQVDATADRVRVSGPTGQSWAVSYDIFVPRECRLKLHTRVGGITVTDVAGAVSADTSVGAIELTRLTGAVDVKTEVGAIRIQTPPADASFDLRTNMGAIHSDLPGTRVESTSFFGRRLIVEAGAPLIRAVTSMGGIDLIR